jgi:hypothetical protein
MRILRFGLVASAFTLSIVSLTSAASAQNASTDHGIYLVPKAGLLVTGSGDTSIKCSGAACPTNLRGISLDDKSGPVFGFDVLARVMPNLRVGGGLLYVTDSSYRANGFTQSVGTDLSLLGIVEGVFPVSPIISLSVRGQLGMLVLFPGGALKDQQNADKARCPTCNVSEGPFTGFTWGIGGGGIFDVGPLGLRADLLYQGITSLTLQKESQSVAGNTIEATQSYSGGRLWFLVGGDIGL